MGCIWIALFKELNPRRRVYVEITKTLEGGAKM
jgi:hypothetical protein